MKKSKSWKLKTHTMLALAIAVTSFISEIITSNGLGWTKLLSLIGLSGFKNYSSAQVGIIGGADGPTAVYVSGSPLSANMLSNALLFVILMALFKPIRYLIQRKK